MEFALLWQGGLLAAGLGTNRYFFQIHCGNPARHFCPGNRL